MLMCTDSDILLIYPEDLINYSKCLHKTTTNTQCKNTPTRGSDYCSIHKKFYKYEKPDDCPICIESLKYTHKPLSCGHWAHLDCVLKWKSTNPICPICKQKIKLDKREEEKEQITNKDMVLLITMLYLLSDLRSL